MGKLLAFSQNPVYNYTRKFLDDLLRTVRGGDPQKIDEVAGR